MLSKKTINQRNMRKLLFTVCVYACTLPLFAQGGISVTGRVSDAAGEPVIGASIVVKGSVTATLSDADGRYAIRVPDEKAILVFSFMGFSTQQTTVGSRTVINAVLQADSRQLDDVVVIGYGTQKKVTLTGAVSALSGEEIKSVPTPSVTNMLSGRLPGLVTVNTTGEPGYDDATLLIRGRSTINGDSSPLVVVDGVPDRFGGFSRIDPKDIESISILKDVSAAIYGARSAAGVILVTTKRGKEGAFRVNYSGNVGFSQPTVLPEMCESWEYATLTNEVEDFNGKPMTYSPEDIQKYRDGSAPLTHPNENAYKATMAWAALQTQHNLSVSGGTEKIKYFGSVGYQFQDNYFKNSPFGYNQYNLRSNVDITPHKNLKISINLAGRQQSTLSSLMTRPTDMPQSDYSWRVLRSWRPVDPIVFYGTNYRGEHPGWSMNPLNLTEGDFGSSKIDRNYYNGDVILQWDLPFITKGLSVTGGMYADKQDYFWKQIHAENALYSRDKSTGEFSLLGNPIASARVDEEMTRSSAITLNARVNYERTFNEVHNVKVLAGYEQYYYRYDRLYGRRESYKTIAIPELNAGEEEPSTSDGGAADNAWIGYFGRVDYDYAGKYLLQFNWRNDGSAAFSPEMRYSFFPGVSVGWRLSEEAFMKGLTFLDNLKLRGSWGQMGHDNIAHYQYLSTYSLSTGVAGIFGGENPQAQQGLVAGVSPNPALTWERITAINIGLDMSFLHCLDFSVEFFRNERNNILAKRNASMPSFSGIAMPDENFGQAWSQGLEVVLNFRKSIGPVQLTAGGNLSYYKDRIVSIDEAENIPEWQRRTGKSIGSFGAMYVADGIFRSPEELAAYPHEVNAKVGDIRFLDYYEDGIIDANDMVIPDKTATPEIFFGINLGLAWKGWSLNTFWQGATNVWRYQFVGGNSDNNWTKDFFYNHYTADNPNAKYPISFDGTNTVSGNNYNSFWLADASYLRLKSVDLSYTLPATWMKKTFIQEARVYFAGYNLLTFTGLIDIDPETNSNSFAGQGAVTPPTRVISLGFDLTF
jgi:TonB-linked SusC/RagA family outer membrane protein